MYACRYSAGYGDQTLRFDLRTNSIADDKAPFVSVRRMNNDGNEMEGYAVHLYNDGTLIGKGYDADKAGNKVALPAGMEARGTDWHSYEINVNGYAITVKRDGQEIASWTDTTEAYATGGFAFWGWGHGVYVDNIEYTAIGEIPPAPGRIALNHSSFDLNLDSMFDLPLYVETYYPVSDGTKNTEGCYTEPSSSGKVTWTSSNPEVATVDDEGRVHPKKVGTTTITAQHIDYPGHTATCEITVYQDSACSTFLYVAPDGNDANDGSEAHPFKTIEKARDTIRAMTELPEGGVTVILKDGKYPVDETIEFTPADSGEKGSPIVYKAENPGKAIITGEKAITGWEKEDHVEGLSDAAQGKVYVAEVDKNWRFHDLYVNGQRQQVSRSENTDTWRNWPKFNRAPISYHETKGTKVTFDQGELDGLDGNRDVEVVLLPVMYWNCIPVVTEIDSASNTAYLQSQVPSNFWTNQFEYGYYNILNTLKYLDQPGEWCVDSVNGKVYYWPLNEDTIETDEITAPKPYELLSLQGDKVEDNFAELVEYITFDGISFQYTDRMPENELPEDWVIRNCENPDAAIYMDGTRHIRIQNCEIAHSGSYGVMVNHYGQYNEIVHNRMYDLGSGGVEFFGYGVGTVDVNHHNFVLFNTIYDMGVAPYQHSPAVSVFGSGRNTIAFNYIAGAPYAGISIVGTDENSVSSTKPDTRAAYDLFGKQSAQYGIRFEDLEKISEEELDGNRANGEYFSIATLAAKYQHSNCNVAEYNILQDYSQSMDDGGALYSWYPGLGNTYANNILNEELTGSRTWVFWLYMDDRAIDFTLYQNLCSGNFDATINKSFSPYENRWIENQYVKQPGMPDGYAEQRQKILDTVQSAVGGFMLKTSKTPDLIAPEAGAQNVGIPTTFRWVECPNAASYTVEVAKDEAFTDVILEQKTTSHALTTDILEYDTTYYVRVTTREYLSEPQVSAVVSFTTGGQAAPTETPKDFQAVSAIDGVLLKWKETGNDRVNVYRKSAASEYTLIKENVSGIGYVDQTVIPGETYTYQIALSNSGGEGLRSEALEVQAPAYETLFEDTFDGDKISDQWKDASGNVPANTATTNGTWVPGGKWKEYYVNNGTTEWTDYVMEADITYNGALAEQESYSGFGPIFRADTTNGNRRFYQLTIKSQTGEIQLAASLDSRNWYHFDLLPGEPIEDGKTYHLRTECSGDVLRIYVDDVLRYETKATAAELQGFVNGGIGIGFGKDKISIDNVWVHAAKEPEKYAITIDPAITNGTVTAKPMEAVAGTEITVTVTPDQGYQLKTGSLKANDEEIVDDKFTMPAEAVTITAEFEKIPQTVDKTELNECVEEAKALREKDYTEESWKKFEAALETAIEIQQDENATQQTVDAAARALKKAMDALEKKDDGIDWPIWVPSVPDEKPSWELPFTDVAVGAWYYESVYYAWQQDLIDGVTADEYQPDGSLTVAEAIKLASALHEMLNRGSVTLENGTANWYDTYVDYAVDNGIIEAKYQTYTKAQMDTAITRNEFVHIFHGAMDSYKAINDVADNAIPDVKLTDAYADEIYDFYRAGILTGSDGAGTFNGKTTIKRSEVATILVRMYDESLRETVKLG